MWRCPPRPSALPQPEGSWKRSVLLETVRQGRGRHFVVLLFPTPPSHIILILHHQTTTRRWPHRDVPPDVHIVGSKIEGPFLRFALPRSGILLHATLLCHHELAARAVKRDETAPWLQQTRSQTIEIRLRAIFLSSHDASGGHTCIGRYIRPGRACPPTAGRQTKRPRLRYLVMMQLPAHQTGSGRPHHTGPTGCFTAEFVTVVGDNNRHLCPRLRRTETSHDWKIA